ncbi:MAG: tetratricopeptide repeat protein [Sterolibacteriaceae bacterium MAG5]|nr:tetratricopeptide repeat protein [Candidatus Nitricoxidireducens bremensis]
MSLLLEALKKAERAKRRMPGLADDDRPPPGDSAPRFPAENPADDPPCQRDLSQLPRELEILDEEFLAAAKREAASMLPPRPTPAAAAGSPPASDADAPNTEDPPETAPATEAEPARQAARRVFAAKHPSAARSQVSILTVGILVLAAVVAIGIHLSVPMSIGSTAASPGAAFAAPAPPPPPAVTPPPPASAPMAASPPPAGERTISTVHVNPPPADPPPAERRAAPPNTADPIRITRSRAVVNPVLQRAFDALEAGETEAARMDYAAVLKTEPRNPDALHGMAAIALRQGRHDLAEDFYQRAVEADPKNAIAQAGLVGLRGQGDPAASESRLKNLIAAQPDQAFLQFALGNLHAAAGRWNEAQQAFFKAHTGDPDQPDYLFNLAVSLDHLRHPQLAARYYGQALAAAGTRAAGFDRTQAGVRLHELQTGDGMR